MTHRRRITTLRFNGPRFDDHGLDVDVLSEIMTYKRILQETAKELWRRKHPDRQRLPKNFDAEITLKFFEIEPGSTGVPLERGMTANAAPKLPFDDELDEAAAALESSIGIAGNMGELPKVLPRAVIPLFQEFGKSLRPDEFILISSKQRVKGVRYDSKVQKHIMSWASVVYSDTVDLMGEVRGTDLDGLKFTIRLEDGRKIPGRFEAEHEAVVLEALGGHASRRLRVRGEGEFSADDGALQQIYRVYQFELVESEAPVIPKAPIWRRLAEIGAAAPADIWSDVPPDLAENLDEYLYGTKDSH